MLLSSGEFGFGSCTKIREIYLPEKWILSWIGSLFIFILFYYCCCCRTRRVNTILLKDFKEGLQDMKSKWRAESVGGSGGFYSVSIIHEWVSGEREGEELLWRFDCCLSVCLYGGVLFSSSSSASVLKNIKILFGDLYAKCRKLWWLFSQFIKDTLLLWLRMVCHNASATILHLLFTLQS